MAQALDSRWYRIMEEWNTMAREVGLSPLRRVPGPKARRDFKLREKDFDDFWPSVLEECRHLEPFARGKRKSKGRTWKISFSYICAPRVEKLLQGEWREEGSEGFVPEQGSVMDSIQRYTELRGGDGV